MKVVITTRAIRCAKKMDKQTENKRTETESRKQWEQESKAKWTVNTAKYGEPDPGGSVGSLQPLIADCAKFGSSDSNVHCGWRIQHYFCTVGCGCTKSNRSVTGPLILVRIINQSISQSISQSVRQSVSISQSINQSIIQSVYLFKKASKNRTKGPIWHYITIAQNT